jgi:ATP-binding protein involved in chromosome partitioning
MSLSKQDILAALASVELTPGQVPGQVAGQVQGPISAAQLVVQCSACDGFVSVRLNGAARGRPLGQHQRQELIGRVERAIRGHAQQTGQTIMQLNVEVAGAGDESGAPAATSSSGVAATPNLSAGTGVSAGNDGAGRTISLSQAPGQRPPARGTAGAGGAGASGGSGGPSPGGVSQQRAPSLPGVKHVVAVGAGKGGVGKSTIAVNLAVGLALRGHAVGLMDGDIYGPSLPTMLGLDALAPNLIGNMLQPFYVHGVKSMTIGKLVDAEKPLIWRGPMAHGAFKQLVEQTEWGELDYLIIDLPPGTGDVALTMAQLLKLSGAVVVCTPQRVAQDDAVRALRMFQQLNIEVLGVVENMSYFIGDDGKEYDIFGRGGAELMAQRTGVPFLGSVPITMKLRENSDWGDPSANFKGPTPLARALELVCKNVEGQVALGTLRGPGQGTGAGRGPTLSVS